MVWPVSGTIARIESTIAVRLGMLPYKAFVIFDRDDEVSAKVLESMHRAGDDATPYNFVSIHRYLREMMECAIMRTTAR